MCVSVCFAPFHFVRTPQCHNNAERIECGPRKCVFVAICAFIQPFHLLFELLSLFLYVLIKFIVSRMSCAFVVHRLSLYTVGACVCRVPALHARTNVLSLCRRIRGGRIFCSRCKCNSCVWFIVSVKLSPKYDIILLQLFALHWWRRWRCIVVVIWLKWCGSHPCFFVCWLTLFRSNPGFGVYLFGYILFSRPQFTYTHTHSLEPRPTVCTMCSLCCYCCCFLHRCRCSATSETERTFVGGFIPLASVDLTAAKHLRFKFQQHIPSLRLAHIEHIKYIAHIPDNNPSIRLFSSSKRARSCRFMQNFSLPPTPAPRPCPVNRKRHYIPIAV